MELLKGTTLDAYLQEIEEQNERMELFRVAEIFDPIVDTLEVAHKAGILHRDLKPANVFLLEDGAVRLLDFGMTRLRTSKPLTAEGTVMGSPSFMAPEAWKGQSAGVDHRADVYSLGVILFRVLAGDLPFSGLSLYEKMVGSTKSERPSLRKKRPDLPRDVDEWVQLALAINREERFQNVRALWNAFLVTFHVEPPERGKRSSLWAKAAGKAKRLAGIADSARSAAPPTTADLPPVTTEPSFITEALRRSIPNAPPEPTPPEGPASSAEETIELVKQPVETTLELDDADVSRAPPSFHRRKPVEKTIEIGGNDFFVEDTLPDPAITEDTLPDPARIEKTLPTGTRIEKTLPTGMGAVAAPDLKPVSSKSGKPASSKRDSKKRRKGRRGKGRRKRR
jgi:serine/threonine protein kinase